MDREKEKKEDEKKKMEDMHQQKATQMNKSAEGSAGLFHKNHEAFFMERRSTDLQERRRRCKVVGPL